MVTVVNAPPGPRWVRPAKVVVETVNSIAPGEPGVEPEEEPPDGVAAEGGREQHGRCGQGCGVRPMGAAAVSGRVRHAAPSADHKKENKLLLNNVAYAKRKAQETRVQRVSSAGDRQLRRSTWHALVRWQ